MNYTSTKDAVSFLKTATLWLIFILNSLSAYGYKSSIICTNDGKYDHSSVLRMHTSEEHCFLPNKNYPPDALSKTNTITGVPWLFKLLLTSVSKDGYAFTALDNMPKLEEPDWNKITETYYEKPPQIESLNTDSIEEHLIPPNLDNSIEEGLQRQWKQLTTQQKNLSNTDSNSDSKLTKSFIYLATVDRQFRVVIVPARKLTQSEQKQLNEMTAQALIKVYRKWLNNKEKDPAEVIGVSNAGDDDNDDDTTQNNPSDYSAFYVMDEGQLSEPGILNTVLGKRLRVLNILRNRARDAINQGNTQLARILRDRITLVEIDIEYFSTQLIPGDSPERYSSNIAELILNTLQRDSQEIQEYEDHQHYSDLLSSLSTPPDLKAARGRIGRQAPGGSDQQGRPDSGSQQSDTSRESSEQEQANRQPPGADGNSGNGQDSDDGDDGDRRREPADPHDLSESTSQSELKEEARKYVEKILKEVIETNPEYEKLNDHANKKKLLLEAAAQVYIDLNSSDGTKFSYALGKKEKRTKEEAAKLVQKVIALHKSSRADSTLNRMILTTFINHYASGLLDEIDEIDEIRLSTKFLKSIRAGELKMSFKVRYNEDGTCEDIDRYSNIAEHKQGPQRKMHIELSNSELKFRFL